MVFFIEASVREDCVLKAGKSIMVFDLLNLHGEIVKSTPSVKDIQQEKFERSFSVYYISKSDKATLEKEIIIISEIEVANLIQVDQTSLANRVRGVRSGDAMVEPMTQMEVANQETAFALYVPQTSVYCRMKTTTVTQQHVVPVANRTIRVDIETLDAFMK